MFSVLKSCDILQIYKSKAQKAVTKTVHLLVSQLHKALHHCFIGYVNTFWVYSLKVNTDLSGFCAVFW